MALATSVTPGSDFSAISPYLQVRESARAKRLALRVEPQSRCVYLVVPQRTSLATAYQFALSYKDWIADKTGKFLHSKPFQDGAVLPIFGEDSTLRHIPTSSVRTKIYFAAEGPYKGDLYVESSESIVPARVERFLKSHAHKIMDPWMQEKAALIQTLRKASLPRDLRRMAITASNRTDLLRNILNCKSSRSAHMPTPLLKVKDMKSRWGSCAVSGEISLSWRLIFAPIVAVDYVIAHEVAHLVHHNHSPSFWTLCRELSRDFDEGTRWMKHHGSELMVYGLEGS